LRLKILKRQTVTASFFLFTFKSVEKGVRYNIRNRTHHFGPPWHYNDLPESALKQ